MKDKRCFYPVTVHDKKGNIKKVRCGKCAPCLSRLKDEKYIRLKEHLKDNDYGLFITLTYSDENLTYGLNPTINVRDVQLFMKRFRKSLKGFPISYYLVGEYGTKYKRPHYHMILFGLSRKAVCKYLLPAWQLGMVHIGTLNERSIRYVCKYHVLRNKNVPEGVQKPFLLCSNGIGAGYVTRWSEWHKENVTERNFYMEYQFKFPLPRYFKEKIYSEAELEAVAEYYKEKFKDQPEFDIKTRKEMYRELLQKTKKDTKFGYKITDNGKF